MSSTASTTSQNAGSFQGVNMPEANTGAETSAQGAASATETPAVHSIDHAARKGSVASAGTGSDTIASVVLSHNVMAQLEKAEAKDAKKLTKILQKEGKTSDKELAAAIKGFGKVENEHKKATKTEAKANSATTKAMKKAQKLERAFLKAKGKFEQAQADASAKDAMLATSKQQTATIFERLQTSSTALEQLRQQKASQDRERSAKLEILKARA